MIKLTTKNQCFENGFNNDSMTTDNWVGVRAPN